MRWPPKGATFTWPPAPPPSSTRPPSDIRTRHKVKVSCHPADLTDSAQVKTVAAACRQVDILVNSAGGIPRGTLLDIDEERWRRAWDLKVFGCINLTRGVLRAHV